MAKMTEVTCKCGTVFEARSADVARGWGLSCGKSCAAKGREKEIKFLRKIKGIENKPRDQYWRNR